MLRLPARHTIVGVVTGVSELDVTAAAQRLAQTYRAVPGFADATTTSVAIPTLRCGIVILAREPHSLTTAGRVTWGLPLGSSGAATQHEIAAVLDEPERVAEFGGVFVLVRYDENAIRLVSSTDFVHTLRRAGGAFATRAVAAVTLAGQRPSIDTEAVGEYLTIYSVLGSGELLTGVDACEEGTVVDITAAGIRQRTAVGLAERLRPGPPPSPAEFRHALSGWLSRASAVPDVALTLTAGRDSGLVASCLAETGHGVPTMTYQVPGLPDGRGAAALARRYGWSHEALQLTYADGSRLPRWRHPVARVPGGDVAAYLIRQAAWGEGMQQPRDALIGRVSRAGGPLPVITGHGGETGRAYFWKQLPDGPVVDDFVERGPGWHLPAHAKERVRATVEAQVKLATDIGRPEAALDLMYPLRQRSWLDHSGLADAPFSDVLPGFLTADISRLMLDIPPSDRRSGAFFDRALALDPLDPRGTAMRAARPPSWAARMGRLSPYKIPNDLYLLTHVLAAFEPGGWLVRDVLGDEWWQWAVDTAPSLPSVRGVLWSCIGIEALHRWLAA